MSSSILKAFNNHLIEFLDDVITVFPENLDIKTGKTFIEGLKKVNPKAIIQVWRTSILIPYRTFITACDYSFFIEKDYKEDLAMGDNKTLKILENIRVMVRQTSEQNKEKVMKYVQNLSKLCEIYFT